MTMPSPKYIDEAHRLIDEIPEDSLAVAVAAALQARDEFHDIRVTDLIEASNRSLEQARAARAALKASSTEGLQRQIHELRKRIDNIDSRTKGLIRLGGRP